MNLSFGTRLRTQREHQQISLDAIAERTKIRLPLLESLERDDLSNWPRGLFRRSYVRAYAVAIGLEPDAVVREFLGLYPDPPEDALAGLGEAVTDGQGPYANRRPPTRFRLLLDSALGVLRAQSPPRPHTAGVVAPQSTGDGVMAPASSAGLDLPAIPELAGDLPLHAEVIDVGPLPADDLVVDAAARAGTAEPAFSPAVSAECSGIAEVEDRKASPAVLAADVSTEPSAQAQNPSGLRPMASLCARLARVDDPRELATMVAEAAAILGASGLILWMWDAGGRVLRPTVSHGFDARLLASVGGVAADSDTAIGIAFRSAANRLVPSRGAETGALVVPLATPWGCAGVLALEFRDGGESSADVEPLATILGAQLSALVNCAPEAHAATA